MLEQNMVGTMNPTRTLLDQHPAASVQRKSVVLTQKRKKSYHFFDTLWGPKYRNSAKRIDVLARIVFPVTFVVFNVFYWFVYLIPYLHMEHMFDDDVLINPPPKD